MRVNLSFQSVHFALFLFDMMVTMITEQYTALMDSVITFTFQYKTASSWQKKKKKICGVVFLEKFSCLKWVTKHKTVSTDIYSGIKKDQFTFEFEVVLLL